MSGKHATVRLGILGAARIVPQAILEPTKRVEGLEIVGIASSDLMRGREFACEHGINYVYDSYQHLLDDDTIDAVYIALSNDLHARWIVAAAAAGKHILIEKPICVKGSDFLSIKEAVSSHHVALHEAIMVRHHPWQAKIQQMVKDEALGKLVSIKTHFTYTLSATRHNSYRFFPERGGGSFFDNSPYWLQFIQGIVGTQPLSIEATSGFNGPNSIDMNFNTLLTYPGGVTAAFFSSYEHPYEATHWFEFENGKLKIRNFFRPSYGYQKLIVNIESEKGDDRIIFDAENYYYNQLTHFTNVVRGVIEPESLDAIEERVLLAERIYQTALSAVRHSVA